MASLSRWALKWQGGRVRDAGISLTFGYICFPMSRHAPFPAAQSPARIRPLLGEFANASLEQAFRESTLKTVAAHHRIGLLVLAALMLAFVVPDYLALGAVPPFWVLAGYRVAIVLMLLAGVAALRRAPQLALHGQMLMWMALLSYPVLFLFYVLRPEAVALNTGMVMVVQLTLFLFWPLRVALTLPIAALGAVGATLCVWSLGPALPGKIGMPLLVTMPAVVGYVAALRLQKTERYEFWLRRQLQGVNRQLEDEMLRRLALQDELQRQAATDLLTGLHNRRAFSARYAREVVRMQRSGEQLSLAVFDLDYFKLVNDRYGHAAGDAVLQCVGQLSAKNFRGADVAARMGGEEFAVLLSGAGVEQAMGVMQRFASTLAGTDVDIGGQTVRMTATIGLAQHQDGEDLSAVMARADAALYAGKQAGRNRVVPAKADESFAAATA